MNEFLKRFAIMLPNDKLDNLLHEKVILFGVGGVGGSVAEMLVRSGVFNLTIVDFDVVDITNINRQVIALNSTVGQFKVDVLKNRLLDINPNANIVTIQDKLTETNLNGFNLSDYDYVIDCIDDVRAKKELIKHCYLNDINIIVSCGAGNRYKEIPAFELVDIHKTSYDPLAKLLRKFCVENRIKHLKVVYTKQKSIKIQNSNTKTIGSVAYYPVSMACVIVAKVINDLLEIK